MGQNLHLHRITFSVWALGAGVGDVTEVWRCFDFSNLIIVGWSYIASQREVIERDVKLDEGNQNLSSACLGEGSI